MQSLLLFDANDQPFAVETIERIFKTVTGFHNVRFNESGGAIIEADFVEDHDSTIVDLSSDRKTLALSGTTDAALNAALILQRHLDNPLRIIDLDYSFDLVIRDYANLEELRAAIDAAQAQ